MDLLDVPPKFDITDRMWNIYSRNKPLAPHYISNGASVKNSTVTDGCTIKGTVRHSVISSGVTIEEGAEIIDSVIMSDVKIGKNVIIHKAVIGPECVIGDGAKVGIDCADDNKYASQLCGDDIVLLEGGCKIGAGVNIPKGSMVEVNNI